MNSADNKPNQGEGRKPQNGVPDLSDLMNRGNQAPEKTEAVDLSSLMNEIRRVPSSGTPKSLSQAPEKEAPRHIPAREPNTVQRPAAARPLQNSAVHTSNAPRRRIRDPKLEAKRRMVSIILATTIILIIAAIGMGVFYAISHLPKKSKDTTATSSSSAAVTSASQTTTLPSETESTTSEATTPAPTPTPEATPFPSGGPALAGYTVVIDPGHQAEANKEPEVMSSSMGGSKDRSAQGFIGTVTGRDESEINLETALLLKDYLESLGCEVYLTRDTNDVDISNKERAEFAVEHDPDLFIRLYCNAANDSKTSGCEVIVPSSGKYAQQLPAWGEKLGKSIEEKTGSAFTGCKSSGNYTGLNWASSVPSFMVRMGYLTNSDDETNLQDAEYQFKMCQAIADFVSTMEKH
ncbi:MAG: N-acetylmuramoyl-L-alanine amidase [Clostridiales bacterium]|nr:N-acetylmuramoyl-L-alanine amidase [Clostridiales bacterium]